MYSFHLSDYDKLYFSVLNYSCWCCNPILVTTFPEWLRGTELWPRTPGAGASILVVFLRAHAEFCRFDNALTSEKSFGRAADGSRALDFLLNGEHPIH